MRTVLEMLRAAGGNGHSAKLIVLNWELNASLQAIAPQLDAQVVSVDSIEDLLSRSDEASWGCAIVDVVVRPAEARQSLGSLARERPGLPWLAWSAGLELCGAVDAMKYGALDVLRNPEDQACLAESLQSALRIGKERLAEAANLRSVKQRFAQLSHCEKQVLSLVLQGRTNKEIAAQINCSLRTVEARRQRILRSMQTESAIELAVLLARNGLMDDPVGVSVSDVPEPHFVIAATRQSNYT